MFDKRKSAEHAWLGLLRDMQNRYLVSSSFRVPMVGVDDRVRIWCKTFTPLLGCQLQRRVKRDLSTDITSWRLPVLVLVHFCCLCRF